MGSFYFSVIVILFAANSYAQHFDADVDKGIISTVRSSLNVRTLVKLKPVTFRSGTPDDTVRYYVDSVISSYEQNLQHELGDSLAHVSSDIISRSSKIGSSIDTLGEKLNQPVIKLNSEISKAENSGYKQISKAKEKSYGSIEKNQHEINSAVDRGTDGNANGLTNDLKVPLEAEYAERVDLPLKSEPLDKLDAITEGLPETDINASIQTKVDFGEVKDKLDVKIPEQQDLDAVNERIDIIDERLAEGQQYENEIKQIEEGHLSSAEKLPGLAEETVSQLEPLQNFSSETQKITAQQAEYQALIQKYKDKKALQKEIAQKAKNVVNDRLNQHSPAFKEANAQLAKAKKLKPAVNNLKDLNKKKTNEMKGKPLYQRLVPGLTFQAYNAEKLTIDGGLQLGYKLSGRFLLGAGGIFRTSFSEEHKTWIKSEGVYGYRAYANAGLYKNFYFHGEFSALFGNLDLSIPENETPQVQNGYFGLGKRYTISRNFNGSILIFYRTSFKHDIASAGKVNMRIEFNYNTSRRKKLAKGLR
jgi:hypothetical protein